MSKKSWQRTKRLRTKRAFKMKFFVVFNWLPLKHFLEDESPTLSFDPI